MVDAVRAAHWAPPAIWASRALPAVRESNLVPTQRCGANHLIRQNKTYTAALSVRAWSAQRLIGCQACVKNEQPSGAVLQRAKASQKPVTTVWAGGATFVILKLINVVTPLRVRHEDEVVGLDVALHGESLQ